MLGSISKIPLILLFIKYKTSSRGYQWKKKTYEEGLKEGYIIAVEKVLAAFELKMQIQEPQAQKEEKEFMKKPQHQGV